MTIIKGNTKQGKDMINKYSNHEGVYLRQVYDNWSVAKQIAWDECYSKCQEEHGEAFSICSHNSFSFTVSWVVENGLRIETANNSYLVIFPEFCE